jgi:hypothetical protein
MLSIEYLYGAVPPVTYTVTVFVAISILEITGCSEAYTFTVCLVQQFPVFSFTQYVPTVTSDIVCVVAPVLHWYPSN